MTTFNVPNSKSSLPVTCKYELQKKISREYYQDQSLSIIVLIW